MIGSILQLLSGGIFEKVGGLVGTIFGNREKRDDQQASADSDSLKAFTAESANQRANRNWFDSLIDGLNRLPRPLGFFAIFALLGWALVDPMQFTVTMTAFGVVPEWLQNAFIMVMAFYYAGRWIARDLKFGTPNAKKIKEALSLQTDLRQQLWQTGLQQGTHQPQGTAPYSPPVSDQQQLDTTPRLTSQQLQKELDKPSDDPMSLPSIVEWNRRNNPNFK